MLRPPLLSILFGFLFIQPAVGYGGYLDLFSRTDSSATAAFAEINPESGAPSASYSLQWGEDGTFGSRESFYSTDPLLKHGG
jgi:hypothetical protein